MRQTSGFSGEGFAIAKSIDRKQRTATRFQQSSPISARLQTVPSYCQKHTLG